MSAPQPADAMQVDTTQPTPAKLDKTKPTPAKLDAKKPTPAKVDKKKPTPPKAKLTRKTAKAVLETARWKVAVASGQQRGLKCLESEFTLRQPGCVRVGATEPKHKTPVDGPNYSGTALRLGPVEQRRARMCPSPLAGTGTPAFAPGTRVQVEGRGATHPILVGWQKAQRPAVVAKPRAPKQPAAAPASAKPATGQTGSAAPKQPVAAQPASTTPAQASAPRPAGQPVVVSGPTQPATQTTTQPGCVAPTPPAATQPAMAPASTTPARLPGQPAAASVPTPTLAATQPTTQPTSTTPTSSDTPRGQSQTAAAVGPTTTAATATAHGPSTAQPGAQHIPAQPTATSGAAAQSAMHPAAATPGQQRPNQPIAGSGPTVAAAQPAAPPAPATPAKTSAPNAAKTAKTSAPSAAKTKGARAPAQRPRPPRTALVQADQSYVSLRRLGLWGSLVKACAPHLLGVKGARSEDLSTAIAKRPMGGPVHVRYLNAPAFKDAWGKFLAYPRPPEAPPADSPVDAPAATAPLQPLNGPQKRARDEDDSAAGAPPAKRAATDETKQALETRKDGPTVSTSTVPIGRDVQVSNNIVPAQGSHALTGKENGDKPQPSKEDRMECDPPSDKGNNVGAN